MNHAYQKSQQNPIKSRKFLLKKLKLLKNLEYPLDLKKKTQMGWVFFPEKPGFFSNPAAMPSFCKFSGIYIAHVFSFI